MTGARAALATLHDLRDRYGTLAMLQHAVHRLLNALLFVECMHIIVLDRERLRPLDPALAAQLQSRLATRTDLEAMRASPDLGINATKLANFDAGDACLLSYAGGRLAGYTWAHTLGHPELIPGLVIAVPAEYVYNYAALTLPEFRGLGLQPYRHHQLLDSGLWRDKRGLLGYVFQTNFASRKGQSKSGYRRIGSIWLFGSRRRFITWFSPALRRRGIGRLRPRSTRAERSSRSGAPGPS
ncbi:MAG: hypothetical protein IT480_12695 [Gammaproteobacteria bacterium]|nr:hypothetical protein [Gammaproteobacteria bacterium]